MRSQAARSLDRLAFELSSRALERQERSLDELRARTGTLLAASSLAASFLGARAADAGSGLLTVLALAAFVASIVFSAFVLIPREELVFSLRGTALLAAERGDPGGIEETYRRLTHWTERFLDSNQPLIDRRSRRIGAPRWRS
jgi:hypothetical protein